MNRKATEQIIRRVLESFCAGRGLFSHDGYDRFAKSIVIALNNEGRLAAAPQATDPRDCPIGLDKTPTLCSAGTCHTCLKARLAILELTT